MNRVAVVVCVIAALTLPAAARADSRADRFAASVASILAEPYQPA